MKNINKTFCLFFFEIRHFTEFKKVFDITNRIQLPEKPTNQPYARESTLRHAALTRVRYSECYCTKIINTRSFQAFWLFNLLQHARSVRGVYECMLTIWADFLQRMVFKPQD